MGRWALDIGRAARIVAKTHDGGHVQRTVGGSLADARIVLSSKVFHARLHCGALAEVDRSWLRCQRLRRSNNEGRRVDEPIGTL
jgi:hypothetical protein